MQPELQATTDVISVYVCRHPGGGKMLKEMPKWEMYINPARHQTWWEKSGSPSQVAVT